MKRLAPLALALATAVAASQACASNHLDLETGSATPDYDALLHEVLKDAFAPSVRLRALVEPSFRREYAVGLKEDAGRFEVFFLQPTRQVWTYTTIQMLKDGRMSMQKPDGSSGTAGEIKRLQAKVPADPKALKVERCEAPVDAALAARLLEDWAGMLDRVAPQESSGVDGTTYHFWLGGPGKPRVGQTWSPEPASEPGMLVGVVDAMKAYCQSRAPGDLAALDQAASALEAKLQGEPGR